MKNQGLSPIGSRGVAHYCPRIVVNPRIPRSWPRATRPAAKTISKQTSSTTTEDGRFENLVARYYRGVCTFASRLTDDPVEAVLLTHAAFVSTRKLLRSRDEVVLVTTLLTAVMRAAQMAKSRGTNRPTRVHADRPAPEPQNRPQGRRCSPRCPICLDPG